MIRKAIYFTLLFISFYYYPSVHAQSKQAYSSSQIKAGLEKLNVLATVLYFAAHPDDENTRLISWLASEKKYRTIYFSLTRGDGGQNLIGTQSGRELGLIRTEELLAARRVDMGEQLFSSAYDFGFSKSPEETFAFWDRENVLREAVYLIRKNKPDVIITRFPPDARGGHGHHQASAMLAKEAFIAAADPKMFAEQLQELSVWQAKRLVWNASNFGGQNHTRDDQLKIEVGQYNPLLGMSYGEIAAISRSQHKSQGFGSAIQRGPYTEYFEPVAGSAARHSLLDDVETSWDRIPHTQAIRVLIDSINAQFDMNKPEASVQPLIRLLSLIDQQPDLHWKALKKKEVKTLILACAGLWMESYVEQSSYSVGDTIRIQNQITLSRPNMQASLVKIDTKLINKTLREGDLETFLSTTVAKQITQPYWLQKPILAGRFQIDDIQQIGYPHNPYGPKSTFVLNIQGTLIEVERDLFYKYVSPIRGELYDPLTISPQLTVHVQQAAYVVKNGQDISIPVTFQWRAVAKPKGVHLIQVQGAAAWGLRDSIIRLDFSNTKEIKLNLNLKAQKSSEQQSSYLHFVDTHNESILGYSTIEYAHIPRITWFPPQEIKLSAVDIQVPIKRVAYLMGAGDLVPQALQSLGIHVDVLDELQLAATDLQIYDAVITGVRLFNVAKAVERYGSKLLQYVADGGVLLEQYNVNTGLTHPPVAPYPFSLGRARVTEEDAKVLFDPEDPHLSYPNRITNQDFDHWIQERGLYFAEEIDPRYRTPLQMHDTGEVKHSGSLLITNYGKGKFVYSSLSFFRQLPAGVPGAYRLFINLLSK